jgi:hypothetical protein
VTGRIVVPVVAVLALVGIAPASGATDGWGADQVVSHQPFPARGNHPVEVAVRTDGSAVGVWVHGAADGRAHVYVARHPAAGWWGSALRLPREVWPTMRPDVAVGPPGSASVVWSPGLRPEGPILEMHLREGRWTRPSVIGRGTDPVVTVDAHRVTTVAWSRHGIVVRRHPAQGSWWTTRLASEHDAWDVALSTNAAGDLVAAWTTTTEQGAIEAAERSADGGWSRPATLMRSGDLLRGGYLGAPQVGVDRRGHALVAWSTGESDLHGYTSGVVVSRSGKSGRWTPYRYLSHDLGESGLLLDASLTPAGRAIALWAAPGGGGDGVTGPLEVRRTRPDGTWGVRHRLTGRVGLGRGCAWIDPSGTAHALGTVVAQPSYVRGFRQAPGAGWRTTGTWQRAGLAACASAGGSFVALRQDGLLRSRFLRPVR